MGVACPRAMSATSTAAIVWGPTLPQSGLLPERAVHIVGNGSIVGECQKTVLLTTRPNGKQGLRTEKAQPGQSRLGVTC